MVRSELVQAVAMFVNRYHPAADAGVALAVREVAGQVLQPAARLVGAVWCRIATCSPANSAIGFGANDMEAIGPLLAAVVIEVLGIRAALVIDVATFWFRLRC